MANILVPFSQFFDNDGNPLSGGKVYSYEAGTTTPKATYTDSSGGTPNANPVILDSAGRADIWITGNYKFILKTSADVTIKTLDNVTAGGLLNDGDYGDITVTGSGSTLTIDNNAVSNAKLAQMAANTVKANATSGTANASDIALSTNQILGRAGGNITALNYVIVQQATSVVTATSTGSTAMPFDDTIPQNTEGNEFITVTITPTSATNLLEIEFDCIFGEDANNDYVLGVAIFQDSTASAIYAKPFINGGTVAAQNYYPATGRFRMTAGTTSATTFKLRAGFATSSAVRINGSGGARFYGGVAASYLVVREMTQ